MTPVDVDTALRYPCPKCEAGVDERCYTPTGRELPRPHADRVKLAGREEQAKRQRADGDAEHRIAEPRWRRLYAACRLELEQRGDWSSLAAEQLEALVRNAAAADHARGVAELHPLVQGSTGQPVANPMTAVALKMDEKALALAKALKLTPDTRGTSAPVVEPDAAAAAAEDGEERDELAELDELARKRKSRPARKRKAAAGRRA